jgi:hypothetical protein
MIMENLENKIIRNRAAFDNAEPAEGHFDRFARKLYRSRQPGRYSLPYYLKVAGILLLVSISSIIIYQMAVNRYYEKNIYSFGKLSPEYREVEDYFIHTINAKYNDLQKIDIKDNAQKVMMIKEMREMDKVYRNLSKELKNDPNNERLINAMIKHYQLKLDILNDMTDQLMKMKNNISNNNHNENKDI